MTNNSFLPVRLVRYLTVAASAQIVIFGIACNKHTAGSGDTVCVTRLSPNVNDTRLSAAGLDSVNALFSANGLSTANLQFQYLTTATVVITGVYSGPEEQVTAIQFINGQPLFADDKIYSFYNGVLPAAGNPPGWNPIAGGYAGPVPAPDSAGHQTFSALRNAFLAHLSESYTAGGPANAKPFIPSSSTYVNSCLNVTLGYLDASMIPGNSTPSGQEIVQVWAVTPAPDSSLNYYPLVYVEDANGKAWGVPFLIP